MVDHPRSCSSLIYSFLPALGALLQAPAYRKRLRAFLPPSNSCYKQRP